MIQITDKNIEALNRRLAGTMAALRDVSPAMKLGGIEAVQDVKRNFLESHTPEGERWLPLKNPSKRRGGASAKPLIDRGILMNGINFKVGSEQSVRGGRSFTVATSAQAEAYSAAQNFGVPAGYSRPRLPRKTATQRASFGRAARREVNRALRASGGEWRIPPRKYMGLSRDGLERVYRVIAGWVRSQMQGQGA